MNHRTKRIQLLTVGILYSLNFVCASSNINSEGEEQPLAPQATIRLLAYNIKHGLGMDNRVDLERTAGVINRLEPDLVALQELDKGARRTAGVDQAAKLGELTGMHHAFGKFMDYQGGEYGMGLLSKYPIEELKNHSLPTPGESPGSREYQGTEPRTALAAKVRIGDSKQEIIFVSIHLYQTAEQKFAQAQKLVEIYRDETKPVILAGDFNSTPDSPVMNLLRQHWYASDKGEDHFTFSSTNPRREIDFIIYRPRDRFEVLESRVIDEPEASDHRPVLLVVKLR
ncbi:endonuclease/exonuclease/phosphatase family protein [Acidobacteria bacterium AH-259-O06]|nr:endonuclease/exonuclease/phosphatase family protein [Acidobacteria bacterium AH-259-O06]